VWKTRNKKSCDKSSPTGGSGSKNGGVKSAVNREQDGPRTRTGRGIPGGVLIKETKQAGRTKGQTKRTKSKIGVALLKY